MWGTIALALAGYASGSLRPLRAGGERDAPEVEPNGIDHVELLVKTKPDRPHRPCHAGKRRLDLCRLRPAPAEAGETVSARRPATARSASSGHRQGRRSSAGGKDFGVLGERMSPFEGKPWSVYVPAGLGLDGHRRRPISNSPSARRRASAAACRRASSRPTTSARKSRGKGTNTRYVTNILPEGEPARFAAGRRGHHAGRPHLELPAAQARPRRPAARNPISRRPTTTASTRRRASPSSASTPTTARSTRRWRSRTAT